MLYASEVRLLRSRYGRGLQRRLARLRGNPRGWWTSADYIRQYASGRSVVDIGGMWGIDGAYSFLAEEAGAAAVTCVDLYRTEEFESERKRRNSNVRMIVGDAMSPEVAEQIGTVDLVMCFGVLYHVPDPSRLIASLRQLCKERLILETLTTPEVPGVPQAGVYLPYLPSGARARYNTSKTGGFAGLAIGSEFDPGQGYANNFWALSPSCIRALLRTQGFATEITSPSPHGTLRHIFVASPIPGS